MTYTRAKGGRCGSPFPVYEDPVTNLLAAHRGADAERDATVAHILATGAGYAYADIETMATIMSRLGLSDHSCVCVDQTIEAMYVSSTAYLVQSRCGRVVILTYRGTDPSSLGTWLGDADVEWDSAPLAGTAVNVHSGFYLNLRATWVAVLQQLNLAQQGRSLVDPDMTLEHPMEALFVTGHSLGGALALLFALFVTANPGHAGIADKLRAVYTFGQPMAIGEPLPDIARALSPRIIRHVLARDIVPSLPPAGWGRYAHTGQEYRYEDGTWHRQEQPTPQLEHIGEISRALLAGAAPASRRRASHYTLADHGPHRYLAALRPAGRVTEFGDRS